MLRISIFQMCLISLQLILNPFQSTDSIVISGSSVRFNQFSKFILESQQEIIKQLEDEDGKAQFCQDNWQKGESVRFQSFMIPTLCDYQRAATDLFSGNDAFALLNDVDANDFLTCSHDSKTLRLIKATY